MRNQNYIRHRILSFLLACSIIFSNILVQPVYAEDDFANERNHIEDCTIIQHDDENETGRTDNFKLEDNSEEKNEEKIENDVLFDEKTDDIDLSYDGEPISTPSNATPSNVSQYDTFIATTDNLYTYGIQNTGNVDGILGTKLVLTLTNISSDEIQVATIINNNGEFKKLLGEVENQEVTYYLDTATLKIGNQARYSVKIKSNAKQSYSIAGTFFARAIDENVGDAVTSKEIFGSITDYTSNTLRSDESDNINPDIDNEEKIFTIIFDSDGGSWVESQNIRDEETITEPDNPVKDGYIFEGWYLDDMRWNFSTTITENMTLKARWKKDIISYTVTFDSDGGGLVDSQEVIAGNIIIEPLAPTKNGYIFLGWYIGDVRWNFDNQVNENMQLVAKWKSEDYHVVSFNPNNGTIIPDQTIKNGNTATCPEYPTKGQYEFLGWFLNDVLYDFEEPVTDDIELDAKWRAAKSWAVLDSIEPFQFPEEAETFKLSKTPPPAGVKLYSLDAHDVPAGKNELYNSTYVKIGWKSEGGIIVGWYDDESKTFYCYTDAKNLYYHGRTNVDLRTFKNVDLTGFGLAVSTYSLFKDWTDVEKINISTFEPIDNGSINYGFTDTFANCKNLKEVVLPVKSIAIKSAYKMFEGCENLEYVDISCIDTETENVNKINKGDNTIVFTPDLRYMFNGCTKLKEIIYSDRFVRPLALSGMSGTQKRIYYNTDSMFKNCPANKPDNWDLTDAGWTNTNYSCSMYYKTSYHDINPGTFSDLTQSIKWKIPSVGGYLGYTTEDYTSIYIGERLEVPDEVLSHVLTGYYVKGWTKDNGVTSIQIPFENYDYGDGLYVAILGVIDGYSKSGVKCGKLFNKEAVNFKRSLVKPDSSIAIGDISEAEDGSIITWYDSDSKTQYWYSNSGKLILNSNSERLFANMDALENISFDGMDFSYVGNLQSFFYQCASLKMIDFSGLTLNKIYDLSNFANGCTNLESVNFGNASFENLKDMSLMFQNCTKLKEVSFKNFSSSKLTSLSKCFYGCSSLQTVDLSGISTTNVINYISMFENCTNLTSIIYGDGFEQPDVSKLKNYESKSNITYKMLSNCKADLNKPQKWKDGNWNISTGTYIVANMTVKFNTNYTNGGYLDPITVRYGDSLSCVIDDLPVKERGDGYTLEGWYTSSSYKEKVSLDTVITADDTFYAKWIRPGYTNTGSTIKTAINSNATIFKQSMVAPAESVVVTDISEMKDKTVLTWCDSSSSTQYWYSTTGVMHMNKDCSTMFSGKTKLKTISLENMDFSTTTNINKMFYQCSSLENLDLSNLNLQNITNSSYLCNACTSLRTIKLGIWNTPKNTNMSYMFYNDTKLETIDVSAWNTDLNTNFSYMFYNCSMLKSINLHGMKTENATNLAYEFYNCSSLQELDLSGYNTNKVTSYKSMLEGCSKLRNIVYGSDFNLKTGLTLNVSSSNATYKMFNGCVTELEKPPLWAEGNWNPTEGTYVVANMTVRFNTNYTNGGYLEDVTVKYGDPLSSVISDLPRKDRDGGYILEGWYTTSKYTERVELDTIIIANTTYYAKWIRPGYASTGSTIKTAINASALEFKQSTNRPESSVSVKDISECSDLSVVTWYDSTSKIQYWHSSTGKMILNPNSSGMFYGRSSLTNISLKNMDASNVTTLYQFFYNCTKLQTVDFTGWNTENVTNMSYLFSGCSSLKTLDLRAFNTSNATTMSYMFNACSSLETINYEDTFTNIKATIFTKMFYNCTANKPEWTGIWDSTGGFKKG